VRNESISKGTAPEVNGSFPSTIPKCRWGAVVSPVLPESSPSRVPPCPTDQSISNFVLCSSRRIGYMAYIEIAIWQMRLLHIPPYTASQRLYTKEEENDKDHDRG
jgi:hypothetical protein